MVQAEIYTVVLVVIWRRDALVAFSGDVGDEGVASPGRIQAGSPLSSVAICTPPASRNGKGKQPICRFTTQPEKSHEKP